MWAPQYPEGLEMKIWIDNITGDVKIISALNHYIGMRPIELSMFPEFSFMKYILIAIVGVGLLAAIINRIIAIIIYTLTIMAAGVAALVDFYLWGYDYGHNLDPNAPIVVPGSPRLSDINNCLTLLLIPAPMSAAGWSLQSFLYLWD